MRATIIVMPQTLSLLALMHGGKYENQTESRWCLFVVSTLRGGQDMEVCRSRQGAAEASRHHQVQCFHNGRVFSHGHGIRPGHSMGKWWKPCASQVVPRQGDVEGGDQL